jgi:hypothetical protein
METTLENEIEDVSTQNSLYEQSDEFIKSKILGHMMSSEMLVNGVGKDHTILHFGSMCNDSMLFRYISQLYKNGSVPDLNIKYTSIDVNENSIEKLREIDEELFEKINNNSQSISAQEFLDNNSNKNLSYDWTLITGIFDTPIYKSDQFKFIDSLILESMKMTKYGVIFSLNLLTEMYNDYDVNPFSAYLDSTYNRYKISKLDNNTFIVCIYKYNYSINN